jgi:membrane protein DedA with SNARE-associated domain
MKRTFINKSLHFLSITFIVAVIFSASIFLTEYVANDIGAQLLVQQFGYIGVLLVGFITGLSMISPVPAATFTPIFTAGGIPLLTAIGLSVIGTMCANFVSYYIGRLGHDFTNTHYPKIQKRILNLYIERKELLPYLVFGFTAFVRALGFEPRAFRVSVECSSQLS